MPKKNIETLKEELRNITNNTENLWNQWSELMNAVPSNVTYGEMTEEQKQNWINSSKLRNEWKQSQETQEKKEKEINRYYKSIQKKMEKLKTELEETENEYYEMKSYTSYDENKIDFWKLIR